MARKKNKENQPKNCKKIEKCGTYTVNESEESMNKSEEDEELEMTEIIEEMEEAKASTKIEEDQISFHTYFAILQGRDFNVRNHHKHPMKHYADAQGMEKATVKKWDEVMSKY